VNSWEIFIEFGPESRSLGRGQYIRICSKCNKENNVYDLCGLRRSLCGIANEDHQTRYNASVSQSPRPGYGLINSEEHTLYN